MQTYGRIPGFKHVYQTDREETAVVRVPAGGTLGLLGKKNEWVIVRGDSESISRCSAEILTHSPLWALRNGTVQRAQKEIVAWAHPEWGALWDISADMPFDSITELKDESLVPDHAPKRSEYQSAPAQPLHETIHEQPKLGSIPSAKNEKNGSRIITCCICRSKMRIPNLKASIRVTCPNCGEKAIIRIKQSAGKLKKSHYASSDKNAKATSKIITCWNCLGKIRVPDVKGKRKLKCPICGDIATISL